MTTGEKLAMYRKQNNYTQEQLAELLGVSRQAISKWESSAAYPETEKLIRISKLYNCSLDFLLKDDEELAEEKPPEKPQGLNISFKDMYFERKSSRTFRGVPLWHVNIGFGRSARGIFALGLAARGVFSCGLLSVGAFSFGLLSLGIVALGNLALGLLAAGAVAVGALAFGAVAVGLIAFGGAAIGAYAVGAAAVGHYAAFGAAAQAQIAVGETDASGALYRKIGELTAQEAAEVSALIDGSAPFLLKWAAELFKLVL